MNSPWARDEHDSKHERLCASRRIGQLLRRRGCVAAFDGPGLARRVGPGGAPEHPAAEPEHTPRRADRGGRTLSAALPQDPRRPRIRRGGTAHRPAAPGAARPVAHPFDDQLRHALRDAAGRRIHARLPADQHRPHALPALGRHPQRDVRRHPHHLRHAGRRRHRLAAARRDLLHRLRLAGLPGRPRRAANARRSAGAYLPAPALARHAVQRLAIQRTRRHRAGALRAASLRRQRGRLDGGGRRARHGRRHPARADRPGRPAQGHAAAPASRVHDAVDARRAGPPGARPAQPAARRLDRVPGRSPAGDAGARCPGAGPGHRQCGCAGARVSLAQPEPRSRPRRLRPGSPFGRRRGPAPGCARQRGRVAGSPAPARPVGDRAARLRHLPGRKRRVGGAASLRRVDSRRRRAQQPGGGQWRNHRAVRRAGRGAHAATLLYLCDPAADPRTDRPSRRVPPRLRGRQRDRPPGRRPARTTGRHAAGAAAPADVAETATAPDRGRLAQGPVESRHGRAMGGAGGAQRAQPGAARDGRDRPELRPLAAPAAHRGGDPEALDGAVGAACGRGARLRIGECLHHHVQEGAGENAGALPAARDAGSRRHASIVNNRANRIALTQLTKSFHPS
ncbi:putative PE-PGRS family protein [Burkholderia gladioli]|nr:putative PE-PGRS family protein [Burkholderia gladioli]